MRLNRFLAAAGLGSRRSCEELILSGNVTINGVTCTNLATRVEPSDVVKSGNRVLRTAAPVTVVLNKPQGFVCTASDERNRRTVFDLLPPNFPRLFHVGRLDKESEGLLILTNDGDLSLKLTHPRYKVEKEYEVALDRPFDFAHTSRLLQGMRIAEGWAIAESVYKIAPSKLKVVLRQGMKRQIRLMFFELGYEVTRLVRTRIGPIRIEGLPSAHWRPLSQRETESLVAAGAALEKTVPREYPREAPRTDAKMNRLNRLTDRPARGPRPALPHGTRPKPPKNFGGKPEEIPFVPRAVRTGSESEPKQRIKYATRVSRSSEGPQRPPGKPSKQFVTKFFGEKAEKASTPRGQNPRPAEKASRGRRSTGRP